MKKIFTVITFLIFQFTFLITGCYAQFQPDVRLTNTPLTTYKCFTNTSGIAANGNEVLAFYNESVAIGRWEIFCLRSTNWGTTWDSTIQVTNYFSGSWYPAAVMSGSNIHVTWEELRTDEDKIFYKNYYGTIWSPDMQISHGTIWESNYPSISVSGSYVHIVWEDERYGPQVYYERSTDGGFTWGTETRLTFDPFESLRPSVSASGQVVHIVWTDRRDGNSQIYYKRSDDGGVTWGADTRFTTDTAESSYPCISSSGSDVCVVWQNIRYGWEIYAKLSTDAGLTWGPDMRLTYNPSNSFYPNVTISGTNIHVVWQDVRDNNWEIYYKRSTDAGLTWGADERLTNALLDSFYPNVVVSGTVVHVYWMDRRDGNDEMYYKRNPTGNPIGIKSISSEIPQSYFLAQNYPNPFNPETNIKFQVPKQSFVKIVVYDNLGREISVLVNEHLNPGTYLVEWDASDYPSGVYFYRIISNDYSLTKKMILLK